MYPGDLQRHVGKFYGKYSGVVVDNADPEQRGHLRVRVDSVFGAATVVKARPCFAAGHFFVPDVQARVWVEFEAGDSRYPIWVGTWYPTNGAPPEARHDSPSHRVVHTPSGYAIRYEMNGARLKGNAEANGCHEPRLFQFGADAIKIGEEIFLTEPDGHQMRFRIASMQ